MMQCTWCMIPTRTTPCEHCGNEYSVRNPSRPHSPEWSRETIHLAKCKVCGREAPYDQLSGRCPAIPKDSDHDGHVTAGEIATQPHGA